MFRSPFSPAHPREQHAGARLTIDLAALASNWRMLRDTAQTAQCAAVVKGDGYGIGLERAVDALWSAGCGTFFVALPEEGMRLREVLPGATVYVLNGLFRGAEADYCEAKLIPVLGSPGEVEDWSRHARAVERELPAAIHVDTGMNRLGMTLDEAQACAGVEMPPGVAPKLLISHLACGDSPDHPLNEQQLQRFSKARELFPEVPASLANSAGVLNGPAYHFDLVRPGIALYGGACRNGVENPMAPVATLEARVLQVREVAPGDTVGYGAAQTVHEPTRVAVVSVGYADGFLRAAGSADGAPGAYGWIAGHRLPFIGRVSMDLIALDVSAVPDRIMHRGAWIELLGRHVPLDEVAGAAGTIGYEYLTDLSRRYARRYVGLDLA
ncbi:alanine racemase [Amorphus orientalis]|uniref:Alanine racemase n=1 Tax=Amorphus orientalis TaxID=649198 RepID=A0AAE3VPV9_9HYPH|nr:alanine racemase [Amorphus orientalis]MDQ0315610.1 alanine racemase [Amorphus orientalis]